jgi:hypothetical protein
MSAGGTATYFVVGDQIIIVDRFGILAIARTGRRLP